MPSFCKPFGFGPKLAMTRPRTGQRNDGRLPAGSAAFAAVGGGSGAACVAIRALWGDSADAIELSPRIGPATGTDAGAADCWADATAAPGITIRSPTLTIRSGAILFALAITSTDL